MRPVKTDKHFIICTTHGRAAHLMDQFTYQSLTGCHGRFPLYPMPRSGHTATMPLSTRDIGTGLGCCHLLLRYDLRLPPAQQTFQNLIHMVGVLLLLNPFFRFRALLPLSRRPITAILRTWKILTSNSLPSLFCPSYTTGSSTQFRYSTSMHPFYIYQTFMFSFKLIV